MGKRRYRQFPVFRHRDSHLALPVPKWLLHRSKWWKLAAYQRAESSSFESIFLRGEDLLFRVHLKDGLMSYWRLVPYLHQQMRPAEGLFHINHIRFPRIKVKRFSTLKDIIATFSIFLGKYILTKVKVPRKRQYRVNEKTEAYQSYNHLQEKAQSGICSAGLEGKKPTLKRRSQCSSRRAMG